jgi:predicted GTPase/uncharacterized protein (DUF697 family)
MNTNEIPVEVLNVYHEETSQINKTRAKVNVLVAGLSGVGKSTLINAVFGEQLARTGKGDPQTTEITAYETRSCPLKIYDTQGFEVQRGEQTVSQVANKINELRSSIDPDNQIHVAWLCILEASSRVENVHRTILELLNRNKIPAVVVLTQANQGQGFCDVVKERAIPNRGVYEVIAQEMRQKFGSAPVYGLEELVEGTIQLLPEAQKEAFIAAQTANWAIKERAVNNTINAVALMAAGTAFIPIPGGHSVALLALEARLIANINSVLGISISETGGKDLVKGIVGIILAKVGGQMAFILAVTELVKFIPAVGSATGVIGGPIGAAITKIFGHLYYDAVKVYAQAGVSLPHAEVLKSEMERLLRENKSKYSAAAKGE